MTKNTTKAIRLNSNEYSLFESYANAKDLNFSQLCKIAIMEKIEDEIDLRVAEESYDEYLNDKETVDHQTIFGAR